MWNESIVSCASQGKGGGKGRIIETYALLGNGSTATFYTEQLLEDLGVHGNKCELSLAITKKLKYQIREYGCQFGSHGFGE